MGHLGMTWLSIRGHLGVTWASFGGHLSIIWCRLGIIWASFGGHLGPFGGHLGPLESIGNQWKEMKATEKYGKPWKQWT